MEHIQGSAPEAVVIAADHLNTKVQDIPEITSFSLFSRRSLSVACCNASLSKSRLDVGFSTSIEFNWWDPTAWFPEASECPLLELILELLDSTPLNTLLVIFVTELVFGACSRFRSYCVTYQIQKKTMMQHVLPKSGFKPPSTRDKVLAIFTEI